MPAVLEQSLYNYLYNMIGQFSDRPIMLFYIERYILLEIFWNLAKKILLITLFIGKPCLGFPCKSQLNFPNGFLY